MEIQTLMPKDNLNQLASSAQRLKTSFNGGNMIWHCWTSEHPSSSTIILLHGGFGSWTHWASVIPELKKHSTVIAADLPGLGDSDDVPLPHSTVQLASIVKQGIDQLLPADKPFHLVGFSFGSPPTPLNNISPASLRGIFKPTNLNRPVATSSD
jgi:predicted alpha/beta-fold hydrolase